MISVDLMGGLGNQLFQIAVVIAYCVRERTTPIFPYSETLNVSVVRPTYWNTLFKKLKKFTTFLICSNLTCPGAPIISKL